MPSPKQFFRQGRTATANKAVAYGPRVPSRAGPHHQAATRHRAASRRALTQGGRLRLRPPRQASTAIIEASQCPPRPLATSRNTPPPRASPAHPRVTAHGSLKSPRAPAQRTIEDPHNRSDHLATRRASTPPFKTVRPCQVRANVRLGTRKRILVSFRYHSSAPRLRRSARAAVHTWWAPSPLRAPPPACPLPCDKVGT
jgi:hypothetical protein